MESEEDCLWRFNSGDHLTWTFEEPVQEINLSLAAHRPLKARFAIATDVCPAAVEFEALLTKPYKFCLISVPNISGTTCTLKRVDTKKSPVFLDYIIGK